GAALGKLLGGISAAWIGGSLAFAGGAMAYLSIMDLIPESASVSGYKQTLLAALAGLIAGFILVTII
ncbi:MAG: ZIP family metal transporter, partial [Christensenellaceae bacterium]|nr:ZIP family metal transporter [Christensenellaceae bacterium]